MVREGVAWIRASARPAVSEWKVGWKVWARVGVYVAGGIRVSSEKTEKRAQQLRGREVRSVGGWS